MEHDMKHDLISYRHRADKDNKTRFIQPRSEAVPSWADDVQPHEAPWPPQTTLSDAWRWLRSGMMMGLGGTQLHHAYLGASGEALFMEDSDHDPDLFAKGPTDEGLSIHVYRSDLAWELPLDGSPAVPL